MNTLEKNRLIADFMGLDVVYGNRVYHESAPLGFVTVMKYDSSSDWLMPVVDKIESLLPYKEFRIVRNSVYCPGVFITKGQEYWSFGDSKFDAIYKAVIDLIEYLNNKKKAG